jgi:hypothetical protein
VLKCRYVCETNYAPNGNATCLNGDWLNDTRCVLLPCPENPVGIEYMNSSSTDCALTESGETCVVECNKGYVPIGLARCDLALWNTSSVFCEEAPCGNFTIDFLDHNRTSCNNSKPHGFVCDYICEIGYENEPNNSTCLYGEWSNASCVPASCPEDPVVENLDHDITLCENTPHGSSCKIVCDEKFVPDVPEATCTLGEWNEIKCEIPASSNDDDVIIAAVVGALGFLLLLLCMLFLLFMLRRRKKKGVVTKFPIEEVELSIQAQETIQL